MKKHWSKTEINVIASNDKHRNDANRLKSDGISDIIAKEIIGIKPADKEKSAKRLRTIEHRFFTVTGTNGR